MNILTTVGTLLTFYSYYKLINTTFIYVNTTSRCYYFFKNYIIISPYFKESKKHSSKSLKYEPDSEIEEYLDSQGTRWSLI